MKNIICLLLLALFVKQVQAQTITIKDAETGNALDQVTIMSSEPHVFAVSNTDGQADLSEFKSAQAILFQSLGYQRRTLSYDEVVQLKFEVLLTPSDFELETVVVSATRWRQNTGDVPSEITVISGKDVQLQQPQTAADLLGVSGKVFIQKSQQGGGSPMIRGFATNRLLYTVDGVRMNTAIFRGGNIQNVISLDPFAIERTEVLFGPGSVMYGSDAIGGVMSFQSLKAQLSLNNETLVSGKADFRVSSANNERTGHFDVNVGWKKWAMLTSFSSFDFDHLMQGSNGPEDYLRPFHVQRQDSADIVVYQEDERLQIPTAYSQKNFMQKLRFSPNKAWNLNYALHYSETSPYGRYDRHNRTRNGLPRHAEWNYGPQVWMMNHLQIEHSGSNAFYDQMNISLAYQNFEESRIDRAFQGDVKSTQTEQVAASSINLNFVRFLSKKNTLSYGAEYVLNEVTSTGEELNINTGEQQVAAARYPQANWNTFGAFINSQHRFNEKFLMQGGVRFTQYGIDATFSPEFYDLPFTSANSSNSALTANLGMVFRPSSSWVMSTNLSSAFRAPNVDDIGKVFDSEPGAVTVPNPDLEAETAYTADFSVGKVFNERLKFDASVYYTFLDNAMVRRNFTLNGQDSILYSGELSQVQAIQNAAQSQVYGVQASLELKLGAGFTFSSDFNYQVGEEELDDGSTSASRHAAPWFGVSRFTYKAKDLTLQLFAQYQGEVAHEDLALEEQGKTEIYAKDAEGNTYAPAWYTINMRAMYQINENFSLSCGIENLDDQRYRPYSSGVSGAGRNFYSSLRINF
jgi:hemoglobin/transferrin/lactoferrin receptor protein